MITDHTIDAVGRITQTVRTGGGISEVTYAAQYNDLGLLQSVTDARGATTAYTYDTNGNRTSSTNALGQTTLFQNHNPHGQPTIIVRPDGTTLTRSFDARGRLEMRTVDGLSTTYAYDAAGRVTRVTQPDGSWRGVAYDTAGFVTGSTNHRQESVSVTRDATGAALRHDLINAAGTVVHTTRHERDALGRVSAVVDSRNNRTRFQYAADGRFNGVTDALGRSTTVSLDMHDRPVGVTRPNTSAMRQQGGGATVTSNTLYHRTAATKLAVTDTNTVATGYAYDGLRRRGAEAGNDAGVSVVRRGYGGDITSMTDARSVTLVRSTDAAGRMRSVQAPSGAKVEMSYVGGRPDTLMASLTDPSGAQFQTYDNLGRLLTRQQVTAGRSSTLAIARDSLGRPTRMTYPAGTVVDIAYSSDAVAAMTVNGASLMTGIAYRPFSKNPTGWVWGNGSGYSRGFDADGRVTSVSLGTVQRNFFYDAAGRIAKQTDVSAACTSVTDYGYDEAGQLTSYSHPYGLREYLYDANGNRVQERVGGNLSAVYGYTAGSNRLSYVSALSQNGQRNYLWEAFGSPLHDGRFAFEYDEFGRMSRAKTLYYDTTYTYNGLGQRVSKQVKGYFSGLYPGTAPGWATTAHTQFFYGEGGQLLSEFDVLTGVSQEYEWLNGQPVAAVIGGALHYINADHLGTPRSIVKASTGAEVWRWDSDPFGAQSAGSQICNGQPVASTGPPAPRPTVNLRFPGQYFDDETKLHYNSMRDYDPSTGRYIQADPSGLNGGFSRYGYVGGNPISFVDPMGLDSWGAGSGPATTSLDFSRGSGTLTATNQNGTVVGVYAAGNFTIRSSGGPWPDGTYSPTHYNRHPESGPNDSYGSNGIIVFGVDGRTGMGLHSGRSGPNSPTLGCVRTTDDAMAELVDRTLQGTLIGVLRIGP